jgi:indole-3-glycerol phosphate synthase
MAKSMNNTSHFLSDIVANKHREVESRKKAKSIGALMKEIEAIETARPPRSFEQALTTNEPPRIIAEIKRRSPSRGELIELPDVRQIAMGYASAGASAISILTDETYFGGSEDDLILVKQSVEIPVLRKDFIIDEFQVYESRAIGADTLLLIVKLLGSGLNAYLELSRKLGMEPLVEVHSEDELKTALDAGSRIIGINARDLETFVVNRDIVEDLVRHIPENIYTIAESGIVSTDVVSEFLKLGIDGFLIGEAFMRAESPAKKLKEFIDRFRISSFIERR